MENILTVIDELGALIEKYKDEIKFKDYSDLYLETLYLCRSCSYREVGHQIRENISRLLAFNVQEIKNRPIHSRHIAKIMEESFCDPDFSIYVLAERFHISISHLSNLFKKEMMMSFSDYLWELRLRKAKELLTETDLSIDEISIKVGYTSSAGFRKKFKADMGMSPVQYRERERL